MVSECMTNIMEAAFGYMDGVEILGYTFNDILLVGTICRDFKAAPGVILNRNWKTVVIFPDMFLKIKTVCLLDVMPRCSAFK